MGGECDGVSDQELKPLGKDTPEFCGLSVSNNYQDSAGRNSSLLKLHSMEGLRGATPLKLCREQKHIIYETPVKTISRLKMSMFKKISLPWFSVMKLNLMTCENLSL